MLCGVVNVQFVCTNAPDSSGASNHETPAKSHPPLDPFKPHQLFLSGSSNIPSASNRRRASSRAQVCMLHTWISIAPSNRYPERIELPKDPMRPHHNLNTKQEKHT